MNYYPHNIGDFNNATRHLTLVERALYRELIDRYYMDEKPFPKKDIEHLHRKVMAKTADERAIVDALLAEFFYLEEGAYHHSRCDAEVLIYKEKIENAQKAGKASVLARAKRKSNKRSTTVQPVFNEGSTEPQPTTTQSDYPIEVQIPVGNGAEAPRPASVLNLPLRDGSDFPVDRGLIAELEPLYPAVDVPQTIREMKGWLVGNAERRKTRKGVKKFITSWLQREQDKHGVSNGR